MCLEKLFSKCLEKPNRNSDYPSDDDESVSQNTPKKMGAGASAAKGAREAELKDENEKLRKALEEEKTKAAMQADSDAQADIAGLMRNSAKTKQKLGRQAVRAHAIDKDYVKTTVPKSHAVRDLILKAMEANILFSGCSQEELVEIVDTFKNYECDKDHTVIKQGDDGDRFYVVESGELNIFIKFEGKGELEVGGSYSSGAAFGELALMYGSPRAATIRASEKCKLWALDRSDFRGVTGQHKLKRMEMQVNFLSNVKIGDQVLKDVMSPSNINDMVLATRDNNYTAGHVIVREGDKGDVLYLIESGSVDVFKKDTGDAPVATLSAGNFFGEKALLSEDVRTATCIAKTDVKCLELMREDLDTMVGPIQSLLDGSSKASSAGRISITGTPLEPPLGNHAFQIEDFESIKTLGKGAFGRVKLVKVKSTALKKLSSSMPKTYALKCLSKKHIVDEKMEDHVENEITIMSEIDHPFVLDYYGAMQDSKQIYFVLEVLLGGELFQILRTHERFPETTCRFYAASVLSAFSKMHAKKIAYRDLKPENLVLDSNGYLRIVDFGLARKIKNGKTWTLCGTPDYLAPEVILSEGHDWAVDYWALGILLYEMCAGVPPFAADDPMQVYENIVEGNLHIPRDFSRNMGDIIRKLLKSYPSKRLGRTRGGSKEVMKHKFFSGFDWHALLDQKMDVPLKPKIKSDTDASNFDMYEELDESTIPACPQWTPIL